MISRPQPPDEETPINRRDYLRNCGACGCDPCQCDARYERAIAEESEQQ